MLQRLILGFASLTIFGAIQAADLDPKAIFITPPKDIKWSGSASGNDTAVLFGDPNKPGLYVVLTKWSPGHMSRPHTHPNDRYIYVISGTWWVGSGTKFDPASTVPVKPGSYVAHFAGQPHYDGAKDEEAVIQVFGTGPLTTEIVEKK